ncbi:MAG: ferredoxin [Flammeovirgaceae bacterium]|nr:ferredoxin [Flammeovirgaceae bacterium]HCX20481.1 DUF4198 domain-containing protein [Cytophagales bacterium]|tara:strand:- start:774 stop:1517 length:744 start_codon:yes stop_codon:yes gene_type:complete
MKNKLKIWVTAFMLVIASQVSAHYLWVETAETGKIGKSHQVQVFFGEYTYGVIEDPNGENFENVKNFQLWVVAPSGKKTAIETTAGKESFVGTFTPTENGTYTVVLNNNEIDVIDYTQYDFGIFKTHYHSTAKVVVGKEVESTESTNADGLVVINSSASTGTKNGEVILNVLYKGKPVEGQEVAVYISDLWSKKLYTDADGKVSFTLPWETRYTVETTKKEEVPGTYKGDDYEFIWHCATYGLSLSK